MKTVITIEDGKVTVQVDDQAPINVNAGDVLIPIKGTVNAANGDITPARRPSPLTSRKPTDPATCGFCRRRGEPCVRHGGERAGNYPPKVEPKPETAPPKAFDPSTREDINESVTEVSKVMREQRASFDDLYNCLMCRNAGDFCTMHEKLYSEGKLPARFNHVS